MPFGVRFLVQFFLVINPLMNMNNSYPIMSAEEAAALINDGDNLGMSGFTAAGIPKAVPRAIAARAITIHKEGKPFQVNVFTGASTSPSIDGALVDAEALNMRTPYQSSPVLRKAMNSGKVHYFDMHLSHPPQYMRYGFLPKVDVAIIEACDLKENGEITVTTAVGAIPTYSRLADKIIVEINAYHPKALLGFHDIYEPADPPHRKEIPVLTPEDRIGKLTLKVDPAKIIAVVHTNEPDEIGAFKENDAITNQIGKNVADFFVSELEAGRLPKEFLPIQSGVGNIANAVLGAMGINDAIPPFRMYTEVIQDAVIDLMYTGKIVHASGSSLTLSKDCLKEMYKNFDFFQGKITLRPQEVSNSPECIRRLGLLCINTAIEADIFGHINSTHIMGNRMMNGIGGSGDFARNGYLTIFTCPSVAKNGAISSIVPMCAHIDHTEHDVDVIITEQGVADIRGLDPIQRAHVIIDKCAHPDYRDALRAYLNRGTGHTPCSPDMALAMHSQFIKTGDMRGVDFNA